MEQTTTTEQPSLYLASGALYHIERDLKNIYNPIFHIFPRTIWLQVVHATFCLEKLLKKLCIQKKNVVSATFNFRSSNL